MPRSMSAIQKAFRLRVEIELIEAGVGDVHIDLAVLNIVGVEHFDGIVVSDQRRRVGVPSAVERKNDFILTDGENNIETTEAALPRLKSVRQPQQFGSNFAL